MATVGDLVQAFGKVLYAYGAFRGGEHTEEETVAIMVILELIRAAVPEIGSLDEWDTDSAKPLGPNGEKALAKFNQMLAAAGHV